MADDTPARHTRTHIIMVEVLFCFVLFCFVLFCFRYYWIVYIACVLCVSSLIIDRKSGHSQKIAESCVVRWTKIVSSHMLHTHTTYNLLNKILLEVRLYNARSQ